MWHGVQKSDGGQNLRMPHRLVKHGSKSRVPVMLGFLGQCIACYGDGLDILQLLQLCKQLTTVAVPEVDVANGEIQPVSFTPPDAFNPRAN
jgi:hypothetical protein